LPKCIYSSLAKQYFVELEMLLLLIWTIKRVAQIAKVVPGVANISDECPDDLIEFMS
jgi:hypothetical protein